MKPTLRLILAVVFMGMSWLASAQVDTTCTLISYSMTPGTYPNEVSYTISNSNGAVVFQGNAGVLQGTICLPADCYTVSMYDSFGDGWNGAALNIFVMGGSTYTASLPYGNTGVAQFGIGTDCGSPSVLGCMDPSAMNYDPNANNNYGCQYGGCTDNAAINFDPTATTDDGSCEYCTTGVVSNLYICTFSNGNQVSLIIVSAEGDTVFQSPTLNNGQIFNDVLCLQPGTCYTAIMSNNTGANGWYNGYFWVNNGQVQVIHTGLTSSNYQEVQFSIDGSCGDVFGCTNELASNYNPLATIDDGSCLLVSGCTDPTAVNYNPEAVINDGSCFSGCPDGNMLTLSFNPGTFANEASFAIADSSGNIVISVANAVSNAWSEYFACVNTGCYTVNMYDTFGDGWDGASISGLNVSYNNASVGSFDMLTGTVAVDYFGINTVGCGTPQIDSCSTSIELIADSLVNAPNTVFVYWDQDLTDVVGLSWSFGDGAVSSDPFPTYYYDSIGTYTLCVYVYFADGCSATDCLTFTIDENGSYGPGGIQSQGFYLNIVNTIPNGVEEMNNLAGQVSLYPNPAKNNLTVEGSNLDAGKNSIVRIYSAEGREVYTNVFATGATSRKMNIDVNNLSAGYYILSFQNGENVQRMPFVKE